MKKLYTLLSFTLISIGLMAQINLSFETWNTGHPDNWDLFGTGDNINDFASIGDAIDENSNPVVPATEQTDNPTDGNSYLRLISFEMTNSFDPNTVPNEPYGAVETQSFNDANVYSNFTFDVKYDIIGADVGIVIIRALDASENIVAQGTESFTGTETLWQNIVMDINVINNNPIDQWQIIISSSVEEVSATFNGNPSPAIEPGSQLDIDNIQIGPVVNPVPNVTNIVATDVSDNGNGSDLEVSFEIPIDESNIENYYAVVFVPGLDMALLNDPLFFVQSVALQITPNGNNHTFTFSPTEDYWQANGINLENNPIVNFQPFVVWIYTEAAAGFDDVFASSNEVTLTSVVGLDDYNENVYTVYPNPAQNEIHLKVTQFESLDRVDFYNSVGQKVLSNKVTSSTMTIDINQLSEGVYSYQFIELNGNVVKMDKLIIVK